MFVYLKPRRHFWLPSMLKMEGLDDMPINTDKVVTALTFVILMERCQNGV